MTLFHVIQLMTACFAMGFAFATVGRRFGYGWGLLAAVGGLFAGLIVGNIPWVVSAWLVVRSLRKVPTDELRRRLYAPRPVIPNMLLHELRDRGDDLRAHLPRVLELMTDADESNRRAGWAALTSVFPDEATRIPAYRPHRPRDDCRAALAPLLLRAAPRPQGGSA